MGLIVAGVGYWRLNIYIDENQFIAPPANPDYCNKPVEGRLVVQFLEEITRDEGGDILKSLGLVFDYSIPILGGSDVGLFYNKKGALFSVDVPVGEEEKWIQALRQNENIFYAGRSMAICPQY